MPSFQQRDLPVTVTKVSAGQKKENPA